MIHCDKLCPEGKCCKKLRRMLRMASNNAEPLATLSCCKCTECRILRKIYDSEKLAKLMVMALQSRGLRATNDLGTLDNAIHEYAIIVTKYADPAFRFCINFYRRRSGTFGETWHRHLSPRTMRAVLCAIMATPVEDSSKLQVEQIVRGES